MAGCHARLSDRPRAQAYMIECLALKPDFSISRFMSKEPYKNAADAKLIAESLLMAGLPE